MRNFKLVLAAVGLGSLMILPQSSLADPLTAGLNGSGLAESEIADGGLAQKAGHKYYKKHRRYHDRRYHKRRYYNRRHRYRYHDDYDYGYYYPYRRYYHPYGLYYPYAPYYGGPFFGAPFVFSFGFGG